MSFMGVGSYLSKYAAEELISKFVYIEIAVGLIGGFSALLLYLSFSLSEYYYALAFVLVAAISTLIGLEIPLVTRILRQYHNLKDALANILAIDYIGALIASILFPIILLPYLGIMKTGFFVGMLHVSIGLLTGARFSSRIPTYRRFKYTSLACLFALSLGCYYSFHLVNFFEGFLYQDQIIVSKQTPYQRIVVTKHEEDVRLYINGSIQFSSVDEYRYHEPLVHIPLSAVPAPEHVLVLGGGDGLAVREIIKFPKVKQITLVDLDPEMINLAKNHKVFTELNKNALEDVRVKIVTEDAYKFIEHSNEFYSVIIIDLPDPNDLSLGKLYTKEFYKELKSRLSADGVLITQSSSPYFARTAFWSINHTLESVFSNVAPIWVYVPSFGPWGFNIASKLNYDFSKVKLKGDRRYLTDEILKGLFILDTDMKSVPAEINRLDNQVLVRYYEQGWDEWN